MEMLSYLVQKTKNFHEAEELMNIKGAYEIKDANDLLGIINHLEFDNNLEIFQEVNKTHVKDNKGATNKII